MTNIKTGHHRIIRPRDQVRIYLKEPTSYKIKGRAFILNDSSIVVKSKSYSFSDISLIKKNHKGTKTLGIVFIVIGSIYTSIGGYLLYPSHVNNDGLGKVLGAASLGVGITSLSIGLPITISRRKFDMKKWKPSVVYSRKKNY